MYLNFFRYQFRGAISAKQCELMWRNLLHPSIKRSLWTTREDEVLKRLAAAGEERYWDVVADELNKYIIDDEIMKFWLTIFLAFSAELWGTQRETFLQNNAPRSSVFRVTRRSTKLSNSNVVGPRKKMIVSGSLWQCAVSITSCRGRKWLITWTGERKIKSIRYARE